MLSGPNKHGSQNHMYMVGRMVAHLEPRAHWLVKLADQQALGASKRLPGCIRQRTVKAGPQHHAVASTYPLVHEEKN